MARSCRFLTWVALILLSGCATRESVESEIVITELQAQVAELEAQLDYAYTEMSRISNELTENVGHLERAIADIDRRVLDLQMPVEPEVARREVEAAVAVTNQRMAAVRSTTDELTQSLAF